MNTSLIPRMATPAAKHFFLFGPRGTGKSTWLRETFAEAAWVDLLEAATYRTYMAQPERLEDFVKAHGTRDTVVIDEVQRVPQLLPVVHRLMEQRQELRFVLTGSSARKLRQKGVDLLAGRAVVRNMHPFLAAELGSAFSLERALRLGTLPLVWSSATPEDTLRSYIQLYLDQEVRSEGLVRNLDQFLRFLEVMSFSHGNALNLSEIGRECQVKRSTLDSYVAILEDLLIACRLPVFSKRAKRALAVHAKFYYFDAGVFRSLRPAGPLDRPEEGDGQALEGLLLQHLRTWIDYGNPDARLHYWRTQGGAEIDFVLYGAAVFAAVEVKNTAVIRDAELRSLRSFHEDYPEAELFFLYRGKEVLLRHGVLCIPVERFLRQLIPGQPLPRTF